MKKQLIEKVEALFNKMQNEVNNSFPSVFTREDVNTVLHQFYSQIGEALQREIVEQNPVAEDSIENVISVLKDMAKHITDEVENYDDISHDIIDLSSATFSLCGNEIELDSVDFDTYEISRHYKESIKGLCNDFIEEYIEKSKIEENETI